MKKNYGAVLFLVLVLLVAPALAMQGNDHKGHEMSGHTMDHGAMDQGNAATSGHFRHADDVEGINVSFQIMSLASMNMKDPSGKTHHIMASFSHDNQQMKQVAGVITVVSPSGKEQTGKLMHFGGGMYAANFTFDESGKWDVTCVFSEQGTKYSKQFTYPHQAE